MSVGTDNLSPNLPQRRNLLFRQGGVERIAKEKIIAVEGSAAGTEGAQVAGLLVPDFIYNIGTTMLNGDILMLIFFFVNKIIFPERES